MTQAASGTGESTAPDAVAVTARMTPKALWTLAITSVAVFMVTLNVCVPLDSPALDGSVAFASVDVTPAVSATVGTTSQFASTALTFTLKAVPLQ